MAAAPIARTVNGAVRGRWLDGGVAIFTGIPYAAQTGPGSRFMPPKPVKTWSGVHDATKPGDRAPQGEDNVFTMPVGDYFMGGNPAKFKLEQEGRSETVWCSTS
jgi:carboxylesterase type B